MCLLLAENPCMWFRGKKACRIVWRLKKHTKLENSWHSTRNEFVPLKWARRTLNGQVARAFSLPCTVPFRLLLFKYLLIFKWDSKSNRIIHTIQHHVRMENGHENNLLSNVNACELLALWTKFRRCVYHIQLVLNANQLCNVLHLVSRKSVASLSGYFLSPLDSFAASNTFVEHFENKLCSKCLGFITSIREEKKIKNKHIKSTSTSCNTESDVK